MHKTYVTFGYDHSHIVYNRHFNHQCVAVIESDSPAHGRQLAFAHFGAKFAFEYPEEHFDMDTVEKFYPRGLIKVTPEINDTETVINKWGFPELVNPYLCKCCECGEHFTGQKHDHVCKKCRVMNKNESKAAT